MAMFGGRKALDGSLSAAAALVRCRPSAVRSPLVSLRAALRRRAKAHPQAWAARWDSANRRLWQWLWTVPPGVAALRRFERHHRRLLAINEAYAAPPFGPSFWRGFSSVLGHVPCPPAPSARRAP